MKSESNQYDFLNPIKRKTVSSSFREVVVSHYPGLNKNSDYLPLLAYLLFPTKIEEETKRIIISFDTIAQAIGRPELFSYPVKFRMETLFEAFSQDIQHFEWSGWSYKNKKARVVTRLEWPKVIQKAIEEERKRLFWKEGRVYLLTGQPFSRKRQYEQMRKERMYFQQLNSANPVTAKLLHYMNHLPTNLFARLIEKNAEATAQTILNLKSDKEHQWSIFSSIIDDYNQLYQPVRASSRIYPVGERIISLKKEVRRSITKGWIECDLKSAQLAVVATLWNVPELQSFLKTGGSIWEVLNLGAKPDEEKKAIFKRALYGSAYGAGKKTLQEELQTYYADFMKNKYVKLLFKARRKQLQRIKEQGGATDCFGHFISMEKQIHYESEHPELSILAQLSQAAELKLLEPAIDLALQNRGSHGFTITLWQHDGFTFKPNHPHDTNKWIEELQKVVRGRANEVNIETELVIEKL